MVCWEFGVNVEYNNPSDIESAGSSNSAISDASEL